MENLIFCAVCSPTVGTKGPPTSNLFNPFHVADLFLYPLTSGLKWINLCFKQEICQKQEIKYVTFQHQFHILQISIDCFEKDGVLNLILLLCKTLHIFELSRHNRVFKIKKKKERKEEELRLNVAFFETKQKTKRLKIKPKL